MNEIDELLKTCNKKVVNESELSDEESENKKIAVLNNFYRELKNIKSEDKFNSAFEEDEKLNLYGIRDGDKQYFDPVIKRSKGYKTFGIFTDDELSEAFILELELLNNLFLLEGLFDSGIIDIFEKHNLSYTDYIDYKSSIDGFSMRIVNKDGEIDIVPMEYDYQLYDRLAELSNREIDKLVKNHDIYFDIDEIVYDLRQLYTEPESFIMGKPYIYNYEGVKYYLYDVSRFY